MEKINNQKIQNLIKKNRTLFWWTSDDDLKNISKESLVEAILNLGTINDVKELFQSLGIKETAKIFKQKAKAPRTNLYPQVINYFKLYFARHA